PGLGGERRLAARRRRVLEVSRLRWILRPVGRDDDVIEPEGEHHRLRGVVLLLVAGDGPVAVWPEALVEIAAVEINQVIAFLDDLLRDHERRALGLRAAHRAG